MDNNIEILMEKQMKWQKITAILLAVLLAALVGAGMYLSKTIQEMTAAVEQAEVFLAEASEKLESLDVDGINDAFAQVDEFVGSMGGIVEKADGMVESIDGVTQDMSAAAEQFEAVAEALSGFTKKFSFFK